MPEPLNPKPWERQTDEPDRAWLAFVEFRDLEPKERSLGLAAANFYGDPGDTRGLPTAAQLSRFKNWSSQWDWMERVRAWDAEKDRAKREAQLEEAAKMGERYARDAGRAEAALMVPINAFLRRISGPDGGKVLMRFNDLDIVDLLQLVRASARVMPRVQRVEYVARGKATEIVEERFGEAGEDQVVDVEQENATIRDLINSPDGRAAIAQLGGGGSRRRREERSQT